MPKDPNAANSGVIEPGDVPPPPKPAPKTPPAPPSGNGNQAAPVIPVAKPVAKAAAPVARKPAGKPAARPKKPAPPKPPQKRNPSQGSAVPAEAADEEFDERATTATWQQVALVYTVSMVLHAAVLLILGLIILPQDVREEILSVIVEEEKVIEPPAVETLVEEPEVLEEQVVEDAPTDAETLVESDVEAEDNFNLNVNNLELVQQEEPAATEGPSLPAPVGDIASGRSQASRAQMLAERGGNAESDAAVGHALEWLAKVQRRDGSWNFNDVGKSSDAGNLSSPTGATGLALMAFLGAGHTHMGETKYQGTVRRGLNYLLNSGIPGPDGVDFRGRNPGSEGMYVQAICATALAEALGMTQDRRIRPIAQGAINFIVRAQHPTGGGWRYQPRQVGDTSVVGWQVMALKSAYHSKILIPRNVGMGVNKFLAEVAHERGAQYSYTRGQKPKASTTAIGLLCRMYMGWKIDNPALIQGANYLSKVGPSRGDIYYDYYASQVMIQFTGARGDMWSKWNTTMRDWLVATQKKAGPEKGSWDVIEKGHKGERGGRLYTTCLAVMTLEIYYRVLPLYKRSAIEGKF